MSADGTSAPPPRSTSTSTSSWSARASAVRSPRCGWPRRATGCCVLEAGRRFEDEDFAETSWDARRYLWAPQVGCYGIQRIHRLPDVVVLAGAGVGGGSLNYANTLYVPPTSFFRGRAVGRHHRLGERARPALRHGEPDAGRGHQPVPRRRRAAHAAHGRRPGRRRHVPAGRRSACSSARRARRSRTRTSVASGPHAPGAPSAATAWSAAGWAPRTRCARTTSRSPRTSASRSPRCARSPGWGSCRAPSGEHPAYRVLHERTGPVARSRRAGGDGAPRRAGRRRVGHPDAAARDEGGRRAAAAVGLPRAPHPHQLRGAARRDDAARAARRPRPHPGRGHHVVVPRRRHHPRRELPLRQGLERDGPARDDRGARRHRAAALGRAAAQGRPRPDGLPAADADPAALERADGDRPGHAEPRQLAARSRAGAGCSAGRG